MQTASVVVVFLDRRTSRESDTVNPRLVQLHHCGAYWCYEVCKQNSTSKRQPSGKRRSAGSQLGGGKGGHFPGIYFVLLRRTNAGDYVGTKYMYLTHATYLAAGAESTRRRALQTI